MSSMLFHWLAFYAYFCLLAAATTVLHAANNAMLKDFFNDCDIRKGHCHLVMAAGKTFKTSTHNKGGPVCPT